MVRRTCRAAAAFALNVLDVGCGREALSWSSQIAGVAITQQPAGWLWSIVGIRQKIQRSAQREVSRQRCADNVQVGGRVHSMSVA
jgi:hypothetical protein